MAGECELNGVMILFRTPPEGPQKAETPYNYAYFSPASEGNPRRVLDQFPIAHELMLSGGSAQVLHQVQPGGLEAMDRALRALESPWDGVGGLIRDGLGLPGWDQNSPLRIHLLAPLEVGLEKRGASLSSDGTLRIEAKAATPTVGRLSVLGYSGTRVDTMPIANSFPLRGRKWKTSRGAMVCNVHIPIPGAVRLTLLLRIGSHVASRAEVIGPPLRRNARLLAYGTVDVELKRLRESLFKSDGTKSKEFERAVARLFLLAGLAVDMLADDPKLGPGADATVYDDLTSTVLVVECTTGPLNQNGKLARLKKRVADVQEAIGHPGSLRAQAVMVSSLRADRLSAGELESAGRDNMAVLSREDLESIFQVASNSEPPDAVLELVRDRVPRRGMSGLIGHWGSI